MNEVKKQELKPVDQVREGLTKLAPQFKLALPAHIPVERFMRVAQTAIAMQPALLNADRQSLYSACMVLAQKSILPDGREGALVPFGDKVTPMVMIAGTLKLLRNSGELKTIVAEPVYENDFFEYWIDFNGQNLNHKPMMFGDRGKQIGIYALAKTKDDSITIEVMSMADIDAVKRTSRSANADSSPWKTFPTEMQKKTIIRRLAKRLPSSTDLDDIHELEDKTFGIQSEPIEAKSAEVVEQKQIESKPVAKPKSKIEKIVEAKTNVTKQQTPEKEAEPRNEDSASELPL